MKPILDPMCGPQLMYFGEPQNVLTCDIRDETFVKYRDKGTRAEILHVKPEMIADVRNLPFEDETFYLVILDPPHLTGPGATGYQCKQYGRLPKDWQEFIRKMFAECFRVLRPNGTLIFKWNEHNIPVRKILELTPMPPLCGNKSGKALKTHWIVFFKDATLCDL